MKYSSRKRFPVVIELALPFVLIISALTAYALQGVPEPSGGGPGTETPTHFQFVPDEILVGFNAQASEAIRGRLNRELRVGGSEDIGIPSIQKLNSKYNVRHIEPVFKGLHNRLRTGKSFNDIYIEIERKYSRRTKRSASKGGPPDLSTIYRIKMAAGQDENAIRRIVTEYANDPNVKYAELNYIRTAQFVPNDPYFSSSGSWGQSYYDLWGLKKIDVEHAWDIALGKAGSAVTVAVVDTGVDYTHEDLSPNIWTNSGEIPDNGIDDDGNGFVDDTRGWDFVKLDNNPLDDHGHGTHVSGTIAAAINNGIGISGIALNTKIMPVKALDYQGRGYDADLAEAIVYAADNGADVQNYSWGGSGQSTTILNAIIYAHSMGCVMVAAAGNSNADVRYFNPAHIKEVITVSSTDHNDIKSDFSNYGSLIDVAAPGGDSSGTSPLYPEINVLSLRAGGTDMYCSGSGLCNTLIVGSSYYRAKGTSMAAPHVSGLASLLLSVHPEFSNEQVRQAIRVSGDDLGSPGFDSTYGFGRINAYSAIQINSPCTSWIEEPYPDSLLSGNVSIIGTVSCGNSEISRLEYGAGDNPSTYDLLSVSNIPVSNGLIFSWDTQAVPAGNYTLRLTVVDSAGYSYVDKVLVGINMGTGSTGPDLTMGVVSVPSTARAGGSVSITDVTRNIGEEDAGASTTSFYLSTNSTYENSGMLLGSRSVGALPSKTSSQGTTSVTIPAGTAPGSYYIIAVADSGGVVAETNETNNVKASSAVKIGPDLTMAVVNVPSTAGAGAAISVTDITTNSGGGDAGASTTSFYLSTNSTYDGSDILLGSRSVGALPSKTSSQGTTSVTIPAGTALGSYYIIAVADSGGVVAEISETNNTRSRSITIN